VQEFPAFPGGGRAEATPAHPDDVLRAAEMRATLLRMVGGGGESRPCRCSELSLEIIRELLSRQAQAAPPGTPPPPLPRSRPLLQPELLSLRQAAKVLRVDRGTTLPGLIASGALRAVTVLGKARIPRDEIDRVKRDGLSSAPTRAPRVPRRPECRQEGASEPVTLDNWRPPTRTPPDAR